MTFREYQNKTAETAIYKDSIETILEFSDMSEHTKHTLATILNLQYSALGLGEVGEVQGKVKKIIRDRAGKITDMDRISISKELGDILWYVSETCTNLGLDMDQVALENTLKLASRKERGVLGGSGDDR